MLCLTQPQCCLTFWWTELQMLLRCYLIHMSIIILILCFVYLCPCLGLIMSHLRDVFFLFSLILIVINHITSFKQMYLFFVHFFRTSPINYFWRITSMKKVDNFQIAKVQPHGIAQLLLDFLPISAWRCLQKRCL